MQHTAADNTLQHTATHCNTLQHTATHHSVLQCVAVWCSWGDAIVADIRMWSRHQNVTSEFDIQMWNQNSWALLSTYRSLFDVDIRMWYQISDVKNLKSEFCLRHQKMAWEWWKQNVTSEFWFRHQNMTSEFCFQNMKSELCFRRQNVTLEFGCATFANSQNSLWIHRQCKTFSNLSLSHTHTHTHTHTTIHTTTHIFYQVTVAQTKNIRENKGAFPLILP